MFGEKWALFAATSLLSLVLAVGTLATAAEPASLTGKVSSDQEGFMEGVLVTAQKEGSTFAYTVVTNARGEYSFEAVKVDPGRYTLKIRAIGYQGGGSAEVAAGQPTTMDLKLTQVKNINDQMTNGEWMASFPGDDAQKLALSSCVNCHTLQRVVQSSHDTEQWLKVMARMAQYSNNSAPKKPQRRVAKTDPTERFGPGATKLAQYLSTINLSRGARLGYELKTLPRPRGKGTEVVITEYKLPRPTMMPHDVITDDKGIVWFSDFVTNVLGSLDPKTGKVTEYPYPTLRPGFPEGALDLESDRDGNLWLALMFQGGIAKFDKATSKFTVYAVPERLRKDNTQISMVAPEGHHVDGKVWMNDDSTGGHYRVDLKTGQWEEFDTFAGLTGKHYTYGIDADAENNLIFNDFGPEAESVGRIDAKTGKITVIPTKTKTSRPRRGHLDAQGRWWFGEYFGGVVGMYDFKKGEMKEWKVPTAFAAPYDAVLDRTGMIWTGSTNTDRIVRINSETGEAVEYLLPNHTNVRRVFVDDRTDPPTFWVGNNDGTAILKLEVPK
jgi:virginiamycin B lyase